MATLLMSVTVLQQSLRIPAVSSQQAEEGHHVHLTWPEFSSEKELPTLQTLNSRLRSQSDSICQQFIEVHDPAGVGRLTGTYEILYLSESFLSMEMEYHYDFLEARDEERFEKEWVNVDLQTGKRLAFSDCFEMKTPIEDWLTFVEESGMDIDRAHPLPSGFSFHEDGVNFTFPKVEPEAAFSWEELDAFFHIRRLPRGSS